MYLTTFHIPKQERTQLFIIIIIIRVKYSISPYDLKILFFSSLGFGKWPN